MVQKGTPRVQVYLWGRGSHSYCAYPCCRLGGRIITRLIPLSHKLFSERNAVSHYMFLCAPSFFSKNIYPMTEQLVSESTPISPYHFWHPPRKKSGTLLLLPPTELLRTSASRSCRAWQQPFCSGPRMESIRRILPRVCFFLGWRIWVTCYLVFGLRMFVCFARLFWFLFMLV